MKDDRSDELIFATTAGTMCDDPECAAQFPHDEVEPVLECLADYLERHGAGVVIIVTGG